VVISIIGVLAALLLPAVQAARETARRMQCSSQLAQLAKASQTYEGRTTEGRMVGYVNRIGVDSSNSQRLNGQGVSWFVILSGELDNKAIYDSWRNWTNTVSAVSFLKCPSDITTKSSEPNLSYVINAGRVGASNTEKSANGVAHNYFNNSVSTTSSDFIDGRSSTLLFSENAIRDSATGKSPRWDTANKQSGVFIWHDTASADRQINSYLLPGYKKVATLNADTARPSSFHVNGVMAAYADGHVAFLRQELAYDVYQQLMTPDSTRSDLPTAVKNLILSSKDYE